jgi:hypothetical protein
MFTDIAQAKMAGSKARGSKGSQKSARTLPPKPNTATNAAVQQKVAELTKRKAQVQSELTTINQKIKEAADRRKALLGDNKEKDLLEGIHDVSKVFLLMINQKH